MDRKLALLIQFAGVDRLSGSLRKIVGLGDSGAQALGKMKREARELDNQLKDVRARLASGSMQGGLVMAERELLKAIEDTNRAIQLRSRFLAIDNRVGRVKAQAASYQQAGQNNMIGGATLLTPFVLAGKQAMDFSSGMVDIQQKAELTNAETRQMAANIMAAARAAHQLPESMRQGVDTLAGLGMNPRQAAAIIEPIGRASTAFKAEMADLAAASFANINTLKVQASDTAKSIDIMAAASNAGAFELKDMARWFPTITAQAQALGQKGTPAVADLSAALQVARRATGTADEAGNNIQNLLAKINSKGTIDAFRKNFGVDLPNALKKAYAEGKTPLEAIAEITRKATGGDLSRLSFAFEDMQAQGAVRALIQNLDDYRKIRAQIGKSSGTVDRAFSQREMQDASVAWASFKGQLSGTAILLGTTLLPTASRFLGMLNTMLGAVGDWAQANPQLASGIMSLVAGLAMARVGLGALQFAFGSVLGPMATAWGWWQKYKALGTVAAAFPRLATGIGVVRTAITLLGTAFSRVGLMMLANPIGIAITAIGLAAFAVYKYWGPISGFFQKNWTTIRNVFLGAMVIFTPWIAAIVYVASLVYRHWDQIKAATMSMVNSVAGIVGPFLRPWFAIQSFLAGLAMKFFGFGANIVGGLIRGIVSMTGSVLSAIVGLAGKVGAKFAAALGIKSPSRLFMSYGGYVAQGLAMGVDRGAAAPIRSAGRLAAGVAAAGAVGLSPVAALASPAANMVPASTSREAGRAMRAGGDTYHITIQQLPGENAEALADRVIKLIEQKKRNRGLGGYTDE